VVIIGILGGICVVLVRCFLLSVYLYRTPAYTIGTNTQKFKNIKGPRTTTSKYCSLIMHILDHIKEDQKANFDSTRTICEC